MARPEMELVIGKIDEEIDERLAEEIAGGTSVEEFVPTTLEQFDWSVRMLHRNESKIADLQRAMTRRIAIVEEQFGTRIAEIAEHNAMIVAQLEAGLEEIGENSMDTSFGPVYKRSTKAIVWPDAKTDPDSYLKVIKLGEQMGVEPRVKVEIDKAAMKKLITIVEPKPGQYAAYAEVKGKDKKLTLLPVETKTTLVYPKA